MRDKEFEKLVDEVTERVTLNILGAHWVCYRCGDKSVIERVEKLEQEVAKRIPTAEPKTGRWIPVSEGLPETGHMVLVTNKDYEVEIMKRIKGGWSVPEYGWFTDEEDPLGVRAWMPLPEPWKGEEP